jgi:subtilisin-like proprotein convertase family protein
MFAPPLGLALALGSAVALASPASAASSTFSSETDVYVGDTDYYAGNTSGITINNVGPATPYPSEIVVPQAARIVDLDVELYDVSHTIPDEIEVLLVGPGGQQVQLWSDAGGGGDLVDSDIYFDDEAGSNLPDSTQITGGFYRPTNYGAADDNFPAPAPAASNNTLLSVFDGTIAAGTWKLFVFDETSGDSGSIGSWYLHFDIETSPNPSTIAVSGLPTITDVNVKLRGFTSTFPDEQDFLLVAPGGQQATLVSDAGDSNSVSGVDLTLDDEAAAPVPDSDQLVTGTYKPGNYSTVADPYYSPAPLSTGTTALSVFDGLSPNGEWRLFAADDTGGDVATLTGWTLEFTWSDIASPTGLVNIAGGATTVSSQQVTLNLNATDPAPASGVTAMRFSNDGTTFSAYQPYASSAAWTLTAGDGVKTVYAQFKDADGNQSAVVNDTVTLALPDTTGPTVTKTTPKNNAKGVKITTKVKVAVSEALLGSSVNKNTVVLKAKGSSKKVKAKVAYNAAKKKIILTPTKSLKKGTKYKVTVSTKVKDAAGNAFDAKPTVSGAQALKFSFTTA